MKVNWEHLRSCIPSRVQIKRNIFYEIVWMAKEASRGLVGETRFDTRQILIELGHSAKQTVITYIHELTHAFSGEYDLGLTETQVLKIENTIYYLLKHNNLFRADDETI